MTVISRHCINPGIVVYQHDVNGVHQQSINYDRFCDMIDYWKVMLVDRYNATAGQTCLLDFAVLNAYYYSAFFAAAELGLVLIIDLPHAFNDDDIKSYKVNIHGRIDYIITQTAKYDPNNSNFQKYDVIRNNHVGVNTVFQEDFDTYLIKNTALYDRVAKTIYCEPDMPFIYSTSSGTTGLPKKIINSHKKVYLMAERLGRLLGVDRDDRVLHTRNLHHGASMCYHFLPGFMIGKEQYTYTMTNDNDLPAIIKFINDNRINQLFLYTSKFLTDYLNLTPPVDYPVKITTLYQITLEAVQLLKEKKIQSIKSPFGDTTIGLGFFVKTADQQTNPVTYDVRNMGPQCDDFFLCRVENERLYVSCPELNEDWATSNDAFSVINGDFYFLGRANQYRINHDWIRLNELESTVRSLFGVDGASIVIDQEMQKIYLAVWRENPLAEIELQQYFEDTYEQAKIDYVLRNELFEHFYNSRKIDNSKIREVCRARLSLTLN
jgi:hypothetical protein